MRYRTVVVGGCTTLRGSTLALLEAFAAAGGRVVWAGEKPSFVDAEPATLPAFGISVPASAAVTAISRGPAWVDAPPSVFAQRRALPGGGEAIVLLNTDRERIARKVRLNLPGRSVVAWDCRTGAAEPAADAFDLPPGGERVLIATPGAAPARPRPTPTPQTVAAPGPFAYSLDEPNVLVLDFCDVTLDGEALGRHEILKADQAVRARFGLEARGGEMVQPWYAEKFFGEPPVLGKLTLRFTFDAETLPEGLVRLALERPDRFVVAVNGATLDPTSVDGWWVDKCLQTLPLPAELLRVGSNEVTLATDFRRDSDLEAIFLLGDFGVRLDGPKATLTTLPVTLAVGDICTQGLPFYSGCVTYRIPGHPTPQPPPLGERGKGGALTLTLPAVGGACVRIGGETIPWPPYTATISPSLAEGAGGCSLADVTVVLTRRNSFGPLHLTPKVQPAYGPGHWVTGGAAWSDDYQLYPAGLLGTPRVG